jgi:hypothetical protein
MPACAALRLGGWCTSSSERDALDSDMVKGARRGISQNGGEGGRRVLVVALLARGRQGDREDYVRGGV